MSFYPEEKKNYSEHKSVLFYECLDWLKADANLVEKEYLFADLTFGGGGHALALAESSKNYFLICTDQDPEALNNGQEKIKAKKLTERVMLEDSNFINFPKLVLEKYANKIKNAGGFHGILLDLGVSSHHFDSPERGFSFRFDAPLDMRMDVDNSEILTAADIVNSYSKEDLVRIFKENGEEPFSERIAAEIIEKRKSNPILTTFDLENIAFHCYPKSMRHGRTSPATRIFQALRIEVNKELEVVTDIIPQLIPMLAVGGRLLIISFHSLEDRIVKHSFKELAMLNKSYKILTKKPIIPTEDEIKHNSRSRSAKLRIIQRMS